MNRIQPYTIRNSRNVVIATINPATTTRDAFPIELPGNGYPKYGEFINEGLYRNLENFCADTPPPNPIEGMFWYDYVNKIENYWDGVAWRPLLGANNTNGAKFPMLVGAENISLTQVGSTRIFTAVGSYVYYPVSIMLFPITVQGLFDDPAVINLTSQASEDVLENVPLGLPTETRFVTYPISGMTEAISSGRHIDLNVTQAYSGTSLVATYKAVIFGHII